jgi:hypothetical protein
MLSRKNILALGLITAVIVILVFLVVQVPRVVSVTPVNNTKDVDPREPLQIRFSQPMQADSVASQLTITPAVKGETTWVGRTLVFTPAEPWPEGKTVQIHLNAGSRSWLGLWMFLPSDWNFTIRHSWLLFLLDSQGKPDLYLMDPVAEKMDLLVTTPHGVVDFSVNPAEPRVIYTATNSAGGSDIFTLRLDTRQSSLVVSCQAALCSSPRVAPDGKVMAYLRKDRSISQAAQIWVRPLTANVDQPGKQVTSSQQDPHYLDWSPSGLLSFYDTNRQGFVLMNGDGVEEGFIADATGEPGSWSEQGYVLPDILYRDNSVGNPANIPGYSSHLFLYSLTTKLKTDLTNNDTVEDLNPVVSPDHQRLAFARRYLDAAHWTPGRQLWVMNSDGLNSHPLTNDPMYNHTGIAWSPDSERLAYIRFNTANLNEQLELWLTSATTGISSKVVVGGYSPQWVP